MKFYEIRILADENISPKVVIIMDKNKSSCEEWSDEAIPVIDCFAGARNDNVPYIIKGMACVIARVFSEAISRFHNGELVAALLR